MNQNIFDKTVTHLLRQGPTRLYTIPTNTVRRVGREGSKRCAACFIGDLFGIFNRPPADSKSLNSSLFYCHDYVPQERWPGFMRGIARWFGLSELSIDIWESEQAATSNSGHHTAPLSDLRVEKYATETLARK